MSAVSQSGRVAELNDQLRTTLGRPDLSWGRAAKIGRVVVTRGISLLPTETVIDIIARVRAFEDFSDENDPYGEHDFASIEIEDVGTVLWKIDAYADPRCEAGSEDPADPGRSFRILTVMLAEEY